MYTDMEQAGYLTYADVREKAGYIGGNLNTESLKNNFDGLELYVYDSELTIVTKSAYFKNKDIKLQHIPIIRPCTKIPWAAMEKARRMVNENHTNGNSFNGTLRSEAEHNCS